MRQIDRRRGAWTAAILLLAMPAAATAQPSAGKPRFEGALVTEWSADGRTVILKQPYGFIDSSGRRWSVPAGARVDGASIPQVFWTFVGGPFEGRYRNASVVHDWYCDRRDAAWRAVHRMFYDAMLAAGVSRAKAKTMYLAVYYGGPRWDDTTVYNNKLNAGLGGIVGNIGGVTVGGARPKPTAATLKALLAEAEKADLDADGVERLVDAATGALTPYGAKTPVLAKIDDAGGAVDVVAADAEEAAAVAEAAPAAEPPPDRR